MRLGIARILPANIRGGAVEILQCNLDIELLLLLGMNNVNPPRSYVGFCRCQNGEA
jgi:hypothetical protein